MNSMHVLEKGNSLIKELEALVYDLVAEHNPGASATTKNFSSQLGLMSSEGIEITRNILKRLKSYGKIENLDGNPDVWKVKST